MAPGSMPREIRELSLALSGNRKRALVEEDAEDKIQENKKRHVQSKSNNRDNDDVILDPELEALFNEIDDDETTEEVDHEPEQGTVLWSEDQEQYPPCAVYHADVKKYRARITEFTVNVADRLSKVCNEGDDIARLHAEAVACQKFPEPKKIVVALMGDAGSGKSSLINSILDIPHFSQEGNYGSACTCAVTEFMSDFPEQRKKFAAKVEFLDPKQRRKLLKDHLREYSHYHFEEDSDWTNEEREEYNAQAQTAEGTFLDLFCGKPSFSSPTELKSYICTAYENDAGAEVPAQMEMWCDELITAHSSSSLLTVETDRAFRLRGALSPFLSSSDASSRQPRLWPVVFKVSIGIKGARVLENLIFADMPGLTDISRVRVKASKNYMRSSDYLWIVVPVMRCISDTGVNSVLYEFGERFAGRLAMICTKTDDSMKSSSFKVQYPHAEKKLNKVEKHLEEAQVNGSRLDQENYTNLRLKFMVCIRNHEVAKKIYEKRSEHFNKCENGPIFFVSNEHYTRLKGYKESGNEQVLAQLDAATTGIPALRKYALSIPAQGMWLTLMTHIQHTSIAFMKSLAIWAARTSADHGDELQGIKEKSTKDIDRSITAYIADVQKDAVQSLAVTMRDNLDDIAQKGYDYLHDTVRGWNWSTIRAVITREGTFVNGTRGPIQWNEKLKQPTVRYLISKWIELFSKERNHMARTEKKVKGDLDALHQDLKEMMELYNIPMEEFGDLINAQKHGITRAVQKYSDNMDKELKNTKQLTENDIRFGYFAQVMKPTYREADQISGKGYKNIVVTMFEDVVNKRDKDSPFIRMANFAANTVAHNATVLSEELQKECNNIYDGVFDQFGGLMTGAADDNGDITAVKTALHYYLPIVDAEMAEIVNKLKAIGKDPRSETKSETTKSGSQKIKKEEKQQEKVVKIKKVEKQQQKGVVFRLQLKAKVKSEVKQEQQ